MKKNHFVISFLLICILFSCTNQVNQGDKFIGTWENTDPLNKLVGEEMISIKRDGNIYIVKHFYKQDALGRWESVFELMNNKLVGDNLNIYFLESSGNLKAGNYEWKKISNNY